MIGFCDLLVESMLKSKQNKTKIETNAKTTIETIQSFRPRSTKTEIERKKNFNKEFKYESYLKLRNLFHLAVLLRVKKLRQHRVHSVLTSRIEDKEEEQETLLENIKKRGMPSIHKIVEDSVSQIEKWNV